MGWGVPAAVASSVLAIFLRAHRATLREASPGVGEALRDSEIGAFSFPQRFGSSLNPHHLYHVPALDGVVSGDVEHGVRFLEATALEARHAEALARTVQLRILRWFAKRGLLDPSTVADMRTWHGTPRFSVDGSVWIEGHERPGLERLVRSCPRGPGRWSWTRPRPACASTTRSAWIGAGGSTGGSGRARSPASWIRFPCRSAATIRPVSAASASSTRPSFSRGPYSSSIRTTSSASSGWACSPPASPARAEPTRRALLSFTYARHLDGSQIDLLGHGANEPRPTRLLPVLSHAPGRSRGPRSRRRAPGATKAVHSTG